MKLGKSSLLLFALLIIPYSIHAQAWSGIIAPSRAIDWSQAGVPSGIPNRTTICTTLAPSVTVAQINSAIQACPAGQVVFLSAGTYNLAGLLDYQGKSGVTVRGAGADQTKLVFTSQGNCNGILTSVCMDNYVPLNWPGGPSNTANWTAGYSKGATSITLDNVANITPGKTVLILDQCDDGYTTASCNTGSATDTGNVWNCSIVGTCASVGGGPGGAARANRAQQQLVLVTAVTGNSVTISPGLYMPNWRSGQSPQAWWANSEASGDGIENLTIDNSSSALSGYGGTSAVAFFNTYGCWATGLRTMFTGRNHYYFYLADHTTVANNYMYGTQNSTDLSYGVENFLGSDNLVVNNIAQHIVSPQVQGGADEGDVWAYNYSLDDFYSTSPGWFMGSGWLHAAGSAMDLWEGNEGAGFIAEQRHGTHNFSTVFRNYYVGNQPSCDGVPCVAQTVPIQIYANSRYFNVIGNVLGQAGYHNNYSDNALSGTGNGNTSIFTLGWSGNGGSTDTTCCVNDAYTTASLMRWGNYDTMNATPRFVNSEVPSSLTDGYANAVPSNNSLPPSFFLPAKPSWFQTPWGASPFPANGPDVTNGNVSGVGGHANAIPAQLCYMNSPIDSNYPGAADRGVLLFNAATCYGQSASTQGPAPPVNVIATVN